MLSYLVFVCFGAALVSAAPAAIEPMPVADIVSRMVERDEAQSVALKAYTSQRRYTLQSLRYQKSAEITVRLTYTRPGKKAFDTVSESGSSTLRNRVLRNMLESEVEASRGGTNSGAITPENYSFRLVRVEQEEAARPTYVLEAEPKRETKYLLRGYIWVDAEDFAITKVEGRPAKSLSFWIRNSRVIYRFEKFGAYWFPASTFSEAEVRLFGDTRLEIVYHDYKVDE